MDKFDRERGGDRYINSSEQSHNYNSSGRHSRGGGAPFLHRHQDNYRGGVGVGRDSTNGFSSSGGRGGGRENHRPFESPPPYPSPPSGGGGKGGAGLRPIGDGMGGFRPVGGGEGFGPLGVGGGRGFRPMGGGGDVGSFRPMVGFGGAGGRLPPMGGTNDSGRFQPLGGGGVDGGGFPPVGAGVGGRFPPMGGGGVDGGQFPPVGAGGGDGGGFRRSGGSDTEALGFQAIDGGGSDRERFGFDNYTPHPLTGQKRGYSDRERSPGREGATFAKLFVGSVPRTSTEAEIRPLFEKHGHVMEVAVIKDKRTGLPQGCCFIKFASAEEADRAIGVLHNQYTLPGGMGPIQVRYADGERERLGATEYKLFVGSLNKQATEKEVEEIFLPYGRVEDVYLMRDELKQSRGCGFVKYSQREVAQAAINALNGTYIMRGCHQPLTVRFADPKRPRPGESRPVPIGEPGPRFPAPGIRPPADHHEPFRGPNPNSWPSQQNLGAPSHVGNQGFTPGPIGALPGSRDCSFPGPTVSSAPISQLNFNQSSTQIPSFGSKPSPGQRLPGDSLPPPGQLPPSNTSFSNFHSLPRSQVHPGQIQSPNVPGQNPCSQALPSQQLPGQNGQHSVSPLQVQHNASSAYRQAPGVANQPQHPQQLQAHSQPPSELAQMLSQQRQTLQATFQSSQQALNQLQQQVQQLQPATQNVAAHHGQPAAKQQSPWPGTLSQPVANTTGTQPTRDLATSTSNIPGGTPATAICNWSEHTSPDGYKYYYNSSTGESKWEKPEELALYEHQQQKPSSLPPQVKSHPSGPSMQQAHHMQLQFQGQQQTQIHNQAKPFQQVSQSPYQVPGFSAKQGIKVERQEVDYAQVPAATGSTNNPAQYQQASQEWMWKNKHQGI